MSCEAEPLTELSLKVIESTNIDATNLMMLFDSLCQLDNNRKH